MPPTKSPTLNLRIDPAIREAARIADGARFHVEADTTSGTLIAATSKGKPKTCSTLDASARWVRGFGIGSTQLDVSRWQPEQRGLAL